MVRGYGGANDLLKAAQDSVIEGSSVWQGDARRVAAKLVHETWQEAHAQQL
jgi:hypothetical protein